MEDFNRAHEISSMIESMFPTELNQTEKRVKWDFSRLAILNPQDDNITFPIRAQHLQKDLVREFQKGEISADLLGALYAVGMVNEGPAQQRLTDLLDDVGGLAQQEKQNGEYVVNAELREKLQAGYSLANFTDESHPVIKKVNAYNVNDYMPPSLTTEVKVDIVRDYPPNGRPTHENAFLR